MRFRVRLPENEAALDGSHVEKALRNGMIAFESIGEDSICSAGTFDFFNGLV